MRQSLGKTISRLLAVTFLCSIVLAGCASGPAKNDLDASVRAAETVLARFQADPTKEVLRDRLKEAKAILIVSPGVDRGVVLARQENDQGWSAPAFYRVTRLDAAGGGTGGAGFSAGKQDLELIVFAMTDKALAWFMAPQLPGKGGMTVSHATGTSGGGNSAADVVLLTRADASGSTVQSGVNELGGTFVSIDKAGNQSYYGHPATPAEILSMQGVASPDAASLQKAVAAAAQ